MYVVECTNGKMYLTTIANSQMLEIVKDNNLPASMSNFEISDPQEMDRYFIMEPSAIRFIEGYAKKHFQYWKEVK